MEKISTIFDYIGAPLLITVFVVLLFAESKRGLRKRTQDQRIRLITNIIVSLPAFTLLRLLMIPAMVWLAIQNRAWHFGLNYLYNLPEWTEFITAFLLLDYTNYAWHILNHKIPVLWRFHLVHHTDVDLDVSTALRFHFGEIFTSVIFRGAAALITGASPALVLVYELVYEAATQFQHSNMRLPFGFEKLLNRIFVTPRMHGIHHSVIRRETDSNYSVIFSLWDRLHATIKLNISQQDVITGVPAYHDKDELTIGFLLKLPFGKIRNWNNGMERNTTGKNDELQR